jgi:hypothetical protein
MTDPLHSARVKLDRANVHARTAKREWLAFLKRNPDPTFRADPIGQGAHRVGETMAFLVTLASGLPDLPDSFSARFGDAIHNYRSALDHVAWQLVKHGSDPSPKNEFSVQFPIYDKRDDLLGNRGRRLPGVADPPFDMIDALHRYVGGQATNDTLTKLAKFTNDDKHRSIHATANVIARIKHEMALTGFEMVDYGGPATPPEAKAGAEIGTLIVRLTTPNEAKVEMSFYPLGYVALEDGTHMLDFLTKTRGEVEYVLDAPEIAAAVS